MKSKLISTYTYCLVGYRYRFVSSNSPGRSRLPAASLSWWRIGSHHFHCFRQRRSSRNTAARAQRKENIYRCLCSKFEEILTRRIVEKINFKINCINNTLELSRSSRFEYDKLLSELIFYVYITFNLPVAAGMWRTKVLTGDPSYHS